MYLTGTSAGLIAEYYLPSSIGFRLGVGYMPRGSALIYGALEPKSDWSSWGPAENSPVYMNASLDYIDIPLQVRYRFSFDEKARLSLDLGGYLDYGVGGKQQVVYTNEFIQSDAFNSLMHAGGPERSLNAFNCTDVGGLFDVEFTYRHFVVGLSYQLGLRKVSKRLPVSQNDAARNHTLNISVGCDFN